MSAAVKFALVEQDVQRGDDDGAAPAVPTVANDNAQLPAVLTVEELATLLRVNRKTAYAAVARGEIPGARRVGRSVRICRNTVLDWLGGHGRVSRKERTS